MSYEHHRTADTPSGSGSYLRSRVRNLASTPGADRWATPLTDSQNGAGDDPDVTPGQDWWFLLDPAPRYLISHEGNLLMANPAGQRALENGQLAVTSVGALKFGSTSCDSRFQAAIQRVAGNRAHTRAILRQRHGGWFAADVHSAPGATWAVLALREELAPTPQSMEAISAAFQLTRSEMDVLHCLLDGQCPKTAANHLHISEHTVRAHLRSIYAKMSVRGLTNTIRLASTFL